MRTYIIKIEQYINKWVTILESKTTECTEADAAADAKKMTDLIYDSEKVQLNDSNGTGRAVVITVANGPVRVSVKEAYFKK